MYKGVTGELPDPSVLQVAEVYKDIKTSTAPLIASIGMSLDDSLVDSAFGNVQAGSVLSYQEPTATARNITPHQDAPPPLPLDGYTLDQSVCLFVYSKHELLHMKSVEVTLEMVESMPPKTRVRHWIATFVRKSRVTSSRFREVC